MSTFNWTIQTHLLLLSLFGEILTSVLPSEWKSRLDQAREKHDSHLRGAVAQRMGLRKGGVFRTPSGIIPETNFLYSILRALTLPGTAASRLLRPRVALIRLPRLG